MAKTSRFTRFDNYFLDHVMPRVSGAEWKIISAVLRLTVGEFREEAEITVKQFVGLTGFASQAVVAAVQDACTRTVVQKRTRQVGRQRTFAFRAIVHANLKALPKPDPRRHQKPLPFDFEAAPEIPLTDCENHNPNAVENVPFEDVGIVKITIPNEGSDCDFHNPNAESYLLIKDQDLDLSNTHTQSELTDGENHNPLIEKKPGAAPHVCVGVTHQSRFTKALITRYAWASHNFTSNVNDYLKESHFVDEGLTIRKGSKSDQLRGILNPPGWATVAHRTGEFDDEIQKWVDHPEIFDFERWRRAG